MARAVEEVGYSGTTAAKAAGITYRQLDYWDRQGIVRPSIREARGSGSQRQYAFSDIAKLRLVKRLLDTGVSLQKVKKALEFLERDLRIPIHEAIVVGAGKTIVAVTSPDEVIDLLNRGQAMFAVSVRNVYEELEGTIAELRPARADEKAEGTGTRGG